MNDILRSALLVSVLAFGPAVAAYAQEGPQTEQPQTESEGSSEGSSESGTSN